MQSIKNKSAMPVKVPLPGGKTLFLGPGKVSEIADKALDHPGVKKLVDEGVLELLGHRTSSQSPVGGQRGPKPSSAPGTGGGGGGGAGGPPPSWDR